MRAAPNAFAGPRGDSMAHRRPAWAAVHREGSQGGDRVVEDPDDEVAEQRPGGGHTHTQPDCRGRSGCEVVVEVGVEGGRDGGL